VGVETIIRDDPQLTARAGLDGGQLEKQPLRVVVDSAARTPPSARVLKLPGKTMIAVTGEADQDRRSKLVEMGAEILELPSRGRVVDLEELLKVLGGRQIISLMVEGGAAVFGSLFEQSLVDKVLVFIAPIIIGGEGAKNPVEGKGVEKLSQATNLIRIRMESVGSDILVSGYVAR
jgi:diaminohydroxyphosphoribosylaminopyrimidine deaminase/5-amino-6-(5-phosphoribosylamino)uracil reductase